MPDNLLNGVGAGQDASDGLGTQSSSAGASAAPASATDGSGAGTGGRDASGSASQAGQQQPGFVSIRDAIKDYGFDPAGYQSDEAALQDIASRARQADQLRQLAQYGQVYVQHADKFNAWLKEQQAAEQAKAQQKPSWWKAPEYDPSWRSLLTRDPATGEVKPVQGAPVDLVQKYLAAQQHREQFLEKFAFDPIGAIKPGIEDVVRQVAEQLIQKQLGGYQDQTFAQEFVRQHSSWLHQRDAQDQVVYGPGGQPQLSAWGQRFTGYVQQAIQMGLSDERARAQYALGMVQRDYALAQVQQQAAQGQGDQGKQRFVADAQRRAGQGGSLANGLNQDQRAAQNKALSLKDRMRQGFDANGVTDQDIARTVTATR